MESTLLPSPKSPLQESRKVVLWLCAGHKGAVPQTEQKIALWMDQLRRMREMQYAYHKKFFHGLCLFLVLVIGCLLWDSSVSLALVPLLVITAGTQSCFYLHFVDFARIHARFVEGRLNQAAFFFAGTKPWFREDRIASPSGHRRSDTRSRSRASRGPRD